MTEQKTEIVKTEDGGNPFLRRLDDAASVGTVEIESARAVAEAQGKLVIAKRFPRDEHEAFERALESCRRHSLASAALYEFPRGGQTVSGPSIRFAEELARCWGNLDFGIRELSQKDGESEMEAYCWDLQTNVISSQKFTVPHERHTRNGVVKLTDPRDKYEMTANQGSRRLRARILAILPPDLIESALEEIKKTLSGGNKKVDPERIKKMVEKFAEKGVHRPDLKRYLGKSVEQVSPDEFANLAGIYTTISDGIKDSSDYFGTTDKDAKAGEDLNQKPARKKRATKKKDEEPAPEQPPAPEAKKEEPKAETPKEEKPAEDPRQTRIPDAEQSEGAKASAPSQSSVENEETDDEEGIL